MKKEKFDFAARMQNDTGAIENAILRMTPPPETRPKLVHEAMRYSLQAGGKRLRPLLCLAASTIFPSENDPLPAAVALECIHTYSLIHDDLPCMDNSDLRRGKPSCHKKFGEAIALLAGDALLTHAFFLLSDAHKMTPSMAAGLTLELSDAAGSQKLIGGQVEDILGENGEMTPERLDFIHANKTAALISASIAMGIRLANGTDAQIELGREIGKSAGIAFQVVDDILDATSDTAVLGKPAGADLENKKLTCPRLFGLEKSRARVNSLTENALNLCKNLGGNGTYLEAIIRKMAQRVA